VDHFYIFDNCHSDQDAKETLQKMQHLVDAGIVTYLKWDPALTPPMTVGWQQVGAFNTALYRYRGTKWMLQVDLDEYAFPYAEKSLLPLLHKYDITKPDIAEIEMCQQLFQTNASAIFPIFTLKRADHCTWPNYMKSIYRPAQVTIMGVHHFTIPNWLASRKTSKYYPYSELIEETTLRMNHFRNAGRPNIPCDITDTSMKDYGYHELIFKMLANDSAFLRMNISFVPPTS